MSAGRQPMRPGRMLLIAIPFGWLGLFFLWPFVIVLAISLSEQRFGIPPYEPLFENGAVKAQLENYVFLLSDPLYASALVSSLRIAASSAFIALLVGYPIALGIARAPERWRSLLLLAVALPFWTSFLIRVYAWMGILRNQGLINGALMGLGIIDTPIPMMQTGFAVHLGIVYSYLPFMVLPIYATLERQDVSLLEAAADLGATPWRAFWTVTFPLSLPGVLAGFLLVFVPAVGEFVVPELLGGSGTLMIGKVLWTEFFSNRDWPLAAALAVALLALIVAPLAWLEHMRLKREDAGQ